MNGPRRELHRVAASASLVLTGVYLIVLVQVLRAGMNGGAPVPGWLYAVLPLPLVAFVPATIAAINTFRAADLARSARAWRIAIGLALLGWVAVAVIAICRAHP